MADVTLHFIGTEYGRMVQQVDCGPVPPGGNKILSPNSWIGPVEWIYIAQSRLSIPSVACTSTIGMCGLFQQPNCLTN